MEKLYVLVRTDLPGTQPAVQAGHALAEYLLQQPQRWRNGTLVYLGVSDEAALLEWKRRLSWLDYAVVEFREPDLRDELTALAVLGAGRELRRIPLLLMHSV